MQMDTCKLRPGQFMADLAGLAVVRYSAP